MNPKRTCSVEVLLACFNISLKVSGIQTQVSVSNKQTSEFGLWLNQKRALRFSTFLPSLQSAMWIRHYSLSLTDNALDFSTLWLHSRPLRSLERLHICLQMALKQMKVHFRWWWGASDGIITQQSQESVCIYLLESLCRQESLCLHHAAAVPIPKMNYVLKWSVDKKRF